jgi:hypothetical protein
VSAPDFEIRAHLQAQELTSHVPPDAETQPEGEAVRLARRQARIGLPTRMRPAGRYADVTVDKQLLGRLSPDEVREPDAR